MRDSLCSLLTLYLLLFLFSLLLQLLLQLGNPQFSSSLPVCPSLQWDPFIVDRRVLAGARGGHALDFIPANGVRSRRRRVSGLREIWVFDLSAQSLLWHRFLRMVVVIQIPQGQGDSWCVKRFLTPIFVGDLELVTMQSGVHRSSVY